MSDINKTSVLKAFVENRRLSWTDFASKEIFLNINGGTNRARLLSDTIRQLENERLIKQVLDISPPTWEALDKAQTEYTSLTEGAKQQKQKEDLEFDNIKRDNWQKRNWLWLTIGGFVLGSIISPIVLDLWKDKHTTKNTPYDTGKIDSDSTFDKSTR